MENKTPTPLKPLTLSIDGAQVRVTEAFPQLNHIRVNGWISAINRSEGGKAARLLAERLGVRSIGGYCVADTDSESVDFPFSFDMGLEYTQPGCTSYTRFEYPEEGLARVLKELRAARKYFAPVTA